MLMRSCDPLVSARIGRSTRMRFGAGYRGNATRNSKDAAMVRFGYALSSEEHRPAQLVEYAARAEESGFEFALISDHFHPWIDRQGQSPFVWSVIGGVAQVTDRLELGTGVTCPLIRTHPAIIAQAAATAADMMRGRFFLGVGTGEALNEHITGERWPGIDERRDMLEEAVDIMRRLWSGQDIDYRGEYYNVESARIYTLPDKPPPVYVAAGGRKAAALAARIGDGIICTAPDRDVVRTFEQGGGEGKPRFAQVTVCWGDDERQARRIAHEYWPTSAVPGELTQELPLPRHFEQAVSKVSEDEVAGLIVCGPDAGRHVDKIEEYVRAGFDHIYVHQVGPDQERFFSAYEGEVLPALRSRLRDVHERKSA
jgi:coenzyme F420-dependent glucose-6-phosphate dehydrogenase